MFIQVEMPPGQTNLPLSSLGILESLEDGDHLLQSSNLLRHCGVNLGLILTQLGVEILSIWGCGHSSTEDGLDKEGVVRLKGVAIGSTEGVRELRGSVIDVVTQSLNGEVKASIEKKCC